MMKHTMQVPDWVWRRAQNITGQTNPASFLRNGLQEWISKEHEPVAGLHLTAAERVAADAAVSRVRRRDIRRNDHP